MNNTNDPRPLQRLVPADNRRDEKACAEALNSPIPAGRQAGSPAPVESGDRHETLVEALESAIRFAEETEIDLRQKELFRLSETARRHAYDLRERLNAVRARAYTGGNEKLADESRREGAPDAR